MVTVKSVWPAGTSTTPSKTFSSVGSDSSRTEPLISTVTRVISPATITEDKSPAFPSISKGSAASATFLASLSRTCSRLPLPIFTGSDVEFNISSNSSFFLETYSAPKTYLYSTVAASGLMEILKEYLSSSVLPLKDAPNCNPITPVSNVVNVGAVMTLPPASSPRAPTQYLLLESSLLKSTGARSCIDCPCSMI